MNLPFYFAALSHTLSENSKLTVPNHISRFIVQRERLRAKRSFQDPAANTPAHTECA